MTRIRRLFLLAVPTLLITFGIFSLAQVEVWSGGFPQVEYRVVFHNLDQQPLKNIKLKVTNEQGGVSYGYPVTDFTEDFAPITDEQGLMVFHHVDLSPEFGGKCAKLFFLFPLGTCDPPQYELRFEFSGKDLAKYRYTDYLGTEPAWDSLPKVEREWNEPHSSPKTLPYHLRVENRSLPKVLDFYLITKTIIVQQK